jgi:hypothetical protein
MKNTDILSRINALLSRNVKLEQQTLDNGTVVEADAFAVGEPIFAIDGDNKEPLEVGSYLMADGNTLEVYEIGKIGEIASAVAEEGETEMAAETAVETVEEVIEEVVLAEVPATMEEILSAVMEAVQVKLDELQNKIDAMMGAQTEMKATLSSTVSKKPLTHKPTETKVNLTKSNSGKNLSDTEARIMAALSN